MLDGNEGANIVSEFLTIPGAVDLHVHLREPSNNKSETIESGTRAARLGGYVLVCDMSNNPGWPTWSIERLQEKHNISHEGTDTAIGFYAGSQPQSDNIDELGGMSRLAVGLKLYGAPTTENELDYEADEFRETVIEWDYQAPIKPIMVHAGKNNRQDLIGLIAKDFKHPMHLCHVSSPEEVADVTSAKAKGLPVTCGVTPHHLIKTSHDTSSEGWFARMMPPLADQDSAEQLMHLLEGGQIDVVETDHAPHSIEAKWDAEISNPLGVHNEGAGKCYGVPGIEHAIPLLLQQYRIGNLSLKRLIEVTSTKPAEIIGVKLGRGTKVIWDLTPSRITSESSDEVNSLARWTPYLGKIVGGRINQPAQKINQVITKRGVTINAGI